MFLAIAFQSHDQETHQEMSLLDDGDGVSIMISSAFEINIQMGSRQTPKLIDQPFFGRSHFTKREDNFEPSGLKGAVDSYDSRILFYPKSNQCMFVLRKHISRSRAISRLLQCGPEERKVIEKYNATFVREELNQSVQDSMAANNKSSSVVVQG